MAFNTSDGSYYTVRPPPDLGTRPPDNCYLCLKREELKEAQFGKRIGMRGNPSQTAGLAFGGRTYHHNDYIMIHESERPLCSIGQIQTIKSKSHDCGLVVRLLGRINDIREEICPEELKNEVWSKPQTP